MDDKMQGVLDAIEKAKVSMIQNHGNYLIQKVCEGVLELESFPAGPEEFHNIQEQELVKAIFGTHAIGVHRAFHIITKMIQEGALVPDYEKMTELAEQYLEEDGQDAEDSEDTDDESDDEE